MERKRQIPGPDGQMDATEIGFRPTGEHWNEYLLDDGTVARVKLIVTHVYRLDGRIDPMGQPAYLITSSNVVAISATSREGEGTR